MGCYCLQRFMSQGEYDVNYWSCFSMQKLICFFCSINSQYEASDQQNAGILSGLNTPGDMKCITVGIGIAISNMNPAELFVILSIDCWKKYILEWTSH